MKLKTILSVSLLFVTITLFSQARVSKPTLKFESKSPKLLKATGWVLNDRTGKWVSNANVLDDKPCTGECVLSNSWGAFKWIQMAKIIYNGEKKYVLMYERSEGAFVGRYNSEWITFKDTHYLVIDSTQYASLKAAVNEKSGKDFYVTGKVSGYQSGKNASLGGEFAYTEPNLLAKIYHDMDLPYQKVNFVINAQTLEGKDIVRFTLPAEDFIAKPVIDNRYFELPLADFKILFWE